MRYHEQQCKLNLDHKGPCYPRPLDPPAPEPRCTCNAGIGMCVVHGPAFKVAVPSAPAGETPLMPCGVTALRHTQQQIIEASQPFVELKVDVLSRAFPKIYMSIGQTLPTCEYSPDVQQMLDCIETLRQQAIAPIMRKLAYLGRADKKETK